MIFTILHLNIAQRHVKLLCVNSIYSMVDIFNKYCYIFNKNFDISIDLFW